MSDLVKRICAAWIADGRANDCFWEGWPECPTPADSLTPKMVMDRIEELEAENADLRKTVMGLRAQTTRLMERSMDITRKAILRLQDAWEDSDGWPTVSAFAATYAEDDESPLVTALTDLRAMMEKLK